MHSTTLFTESVSLSADFSLFPVLCAGTSGPRRLDGTGSGGSATQMGGAEWRHFAYVRIEPPRRDADRTASNPEQIGDDDWLLACARVTALVERCAPRGALLDLGVCTDGEASDALAGLLARLAAAGLPARVGVGPGLSLVQLALLRARARAPAFALVTPAAARAFLHDVPVTLLPRLHPQGSVTPEVVERLRRYGLHTLGHVARLGEPVLRRQFGVAGTALAAIAAGYDQRPLLPTPLPQRLRFRLRFAESPATPERALAALPGFVARVAEHLRLTERRVRELRLSTRWERGGHERVRCTLRDYTDDARHLTDAARRLLLSLLERERPDERDALLDELRLTLLDIVPAAAEQHSFWRTGAQRAAALGGVADTLAHRYGYPILLRPHCSESAAVLAEERHRLVATQAADARHIASQTRRSAPRWASGPVPREAPEDVWRDVPLRLHWW